MSFRRRRDGVIQIYLNYFLIFSNIGIFDPYKLFENFEDFSLQKLCTTSYIFNNKIKIVYGCFSEKLYKLSLDYFFYFVLQVHEITQGV